MVHKIQQFSLWHTGGLAGGSGDQEIPEMGDEVRGEAREVLAGIRLLGDNTQSTACIPCEKEIRESDDRFF